MLRNVFPISNGMEILEKIFGEINKIKLMKLFIFNPAVVLDMETICKKLRGKQRQVKRDLIILLKIGFLKNKDMRSKSGRKVKGFTLNQTFDYLEAFKAFLLQVLPFSNDEIIKKLGKAGRLKAVAVSGVFLNNDESRIDLLIIGDRLKKSTLNNAIKDIEGGIGKEIKFTCLESGDFTYRMEVRDKLLRDIFDYSHRIILDKIGIRI